MELTSSEKKNYLRIKTSGKIDFDKQIYLYNLNDNGKPGFEVINSIKIKNENYLINRGWIPFVKKVLEITNGKGVPVVYDGVGKDTLDGSIECLAIRGMMVSFGNASGPLSDINVPKVIQPKGLYLVRPSMQQYLSTREELDEASKTMFEKISSGKVKIKIFKKYKLEDVVKAHQDLEGRKILGPAVIVPN